MIKGIHEFMAVFFIAIIISANLAFAKSVTLNMGFSISDKDNTIHVNGTDYSGLQSNSLTFTSLDKKFISAEKNSKVLAIVFAGDEFLSAYFNTGYSSSAYLLQMSQEHRKNRFLLAFTNRTWRNIDDKASSVEDSKILSKTFGNLAFSIPQTFPLFIRLEYDSIDLFTRLRFDSPTRLLIRNAGVGRPNITMTVM